MLSIVKDGQRGYLSKGLYYSYIGYAEMVSIFLLIISLAHIFFASVIGGIRVERCDTAVAIVGIVFLGAVILTCALALCDDEDNPFCVVRKGLEAKGIVYIARLTTVVFMTYTLAVLAIVLGTGGSQSSPFASILLINATFGYSLANNKCVRRAAAAAPIALYILALVVSVDATSIGIELNGANDWYLRLSYVLVAVLVAVMTRAVQQKGGLQKQERETEEQGEADELQRQA